MPETFDADIIDEVISVETAQALELRRAAAEEARSGISSGAALGRNGRRRRSPRAGRGKKIVTLRPLRWSVTFTGPCSRPRGLIFPT